MTPRYLSPQQARLAVEAAGLDPTRPIGHVGSGRRHVPVRVVGMQHVRRCSALLGNG